MFTLNIGMFAVDIEMPTVDIAGVYCHCTNCMFTVDI